MDDLKNKSGRSKCRTIELKESIDAKLWIPKLDICYHRVHFNVKRSFPRATSDVQDCSNQVLGEEGKGCPICALLPTLWKEWKAMDKAKNSDGKKKVQDKINQLVTEEIFINVIDIEDPDKRFQACRFTRVRGLQILKTVQALAAAGGNGPKKINELIWFYKMTVSPKGKKEYQLNNFDSAELRAIANSLSKDYAALAARTYEAGGLIDLDGSILRNNTPQSIKDCIEGKSESETVAEHTPPTGLDVDDDNAIPLDSLTSSDTSGGLGDVDSTSTTDSLGDVDGLGDGLGDALGEDGLDIDGIDLDEPILPATKKFNVVMFKEMIDKRNVPLINAIIKFAINSKFIEDKKDLKLNVKAVYTYIQTNTEIEVPETELSGIPF